MRLPKSEAAKRRQATVNHKRVIAIVGVDYLLTETLNATQAERVHAFDCVERSTLTPLNMRRSCAAYRSSCRPTP